MAMSEADTKLLFEACTAGDHAKLFSFLSATRCPDLSVLRDDDNQSLLNIACKHGRYTVAEALITFFGCRLTMADVEAVFSASHLQLAIVIAQNPNWLSGAAFHKNFMLHFACRFGNLPIVRCIVYRESTPLLREPTASINKALDLLKSHLVNEANDENEIPVMVACRYGFIKIVQFLLEEVAHDSTYHHSIISVLLCVASKYNHQHLAKYLIGVHKACWNSAISPLPTRTSHRTLPNKDIIHPSTALDYAVLYNNVDLMKLMMNYKKPEYCSQPNNTLLHFACISDSLEVVELLIKECHLGVDVQNEHKSTPLHVACKWGSMHVAEYFLEKECDINITNKDDETALVVAAKYGHERLCKMLLSKAECKVDIFGMLSPLHYACYTFSASMIQLLLQKGCDMNLADDCGITPLAIACCSGNTEVVTVLTEQCKINEENKCKETPIHILCRLKILDLLKKVLLPDCDVDIDTPNVCGETPLHIACAKDAIDFVAFLLEHKYCDVNVKRFDGFTAMHIAVARSHLECVELLKPFSDVSAQDCHGNTPIHLACNNVSGHEIAKCLLEDVKGDVISATNHAGDAAIHIACRSGSIEALKYLIIEKHCDPSMPNTGNGNTPLHIACEALRYDVAEYLLKSCGVDPCRKNCKGDTPLCHAVKTTRLMYMYPNDMCNFIVSLISNSLIDPHKESSGNVPFIHFLLQMKLVSLIIWLINKRFCLPVEKDVDGNTLLHVMCSTSVRFEPLYTIGQVDLLASLIDSLFSPDFEDMYIAEFENPKGSTPLHFACRTKRQKFVEAILKCEKLRKRFISSKDANGRTPIEFAHSFEVITLLIGYGANPSDVGKKYDSILKRYEADYPLENVKVVILGNSGVGKTTLTQALQKTEGPEVTDVGGPTSGIATSKYHHAASGNSIMFHDFAGQVEFESLNSEFLRNLLSYTESPSLPVIILVFDSSSQKIERNLHYWFSFLKNNGVETGVKCHVILVGSHSDQIHLSTDQIKGIIKRVNQCHPVKCLGPVLLDCRKIGSEGIASLWASISQSRTSLVNSIKKDCRCHIMFAHLCSLSVLYITFRKLQFHIRKYRSDRYPLPFVRDDLIDILKTLHNEGHILILNSSAGDDDDFFIIIRQDALYKHMCGKLFAPVGNPQFENKLKLENNTGVVPVSKLCKLFPFMNPHLMREFLVHLQLCLPIEDSETLKLINCISNECATDCEQSSMKVQEDPNMYVREPYSPTAVRVVVPRHERYFFPGFVKREKPPDTFAVDASVSYGYECGWLLQCKVNEFLSPRYLQVLLLRFVFNFTAASSDSHYERRCYIWKNGLNWSTQSGVEVFLEILEQNTAVILLMRCHRNCEIQCISLRSDIIKRVLALKEEFCPSTAVDEYVLVNPSSTTLVAGCDLDCCRKVNFRDISSSIGKNNDFALDNFYKSNCLSKLLYFDGLCAIRQQDLTDLFNPDSAETEIPNKVFLPLAISLAERDQYEQVVAVVKHALDVSQIEIAHVEEGLDRHNTTKLIVNIFERVWKVRHSKAKYSDMRELLESYSIFRGRNPCTI